MARTRKAKSPKRASPAAAVERTEPAPVINSPAATSTVSRRSGSAGRRRREREQHQAALEYPSAEAPRPGSAERRRRELQERRAQLGRQSAEPAEKPPSDTVDRLLATEEGTVRAFIASRTAQMDHRKYQMSLIKDFVDDPSRFGIKAGAIPTSTSLQEFAEKRSELQYRIAMTRTFLDLLTEDLRLLEQAEDYARNGSDGDRKAESTKS